MEKLDEVLTELWRLLLTFALGMFVRGLRKLAASARSHFARIRVAERRIQRLEKLAEKIAERLGVQYNEESRVNEDDTR